MLASMLANYLVAKDWTVALIAFTHPSEAPFFGLDQKVQYISLGLVGHSKYMIQALWKNARLVYRLRRTISSQATDVVISFLNIGNVFTVFATREDSAFQ